MRWFPLILALVLLSPGGARAVTVGELARIQGQGDSVLRGTGLVVGLPGTGESGKEPLVSRPLAKLLENSGHPLADLIEVKNAKSVAFVAVSCRIPETGARRDDVFDAYVNVIGSASNIRGGRLIVTVLKGPHKDDPVLYAMAEGPVEVEDPRVSTSGRIRDGVRMIEDVVTGAIDGPSFTLVLRPHFSGYAPATRVAEAITQKIYARDRARLDTLPPVATVIDDRSIRIDIPPPEMEDKAAFVADVLGTEIRDMRLLGLQAMVIVNSQTGAIILTSDVEIGSVAITHRDLTITTTMPTPVPTPDNPILETTRMTTMPARPPSRESARLQDLLAAFKQLNVPVDDQIEILQMIQKTGRLQARLVID